MPHRIEYHEKIMPQADIIRIRIRDLDGGEQICNHSTIPQTKVDFNEEYVIFWIDEKVKIASREKPEPSTNYHIITNDQGTKECFVKKNGQTRTIPMAGMGQIKALLLGDLSNFKRTGKRVLIIEKKLPSTLENKIQ
ncbi:hypothetical protein COV15_01090 [Candidatus Woesearchaeota archaeon CG10_big_fil_rev_8_21_14_0_10_34_12]|nr:MAG: hypothetical protein COV15_01090 [Candidatus Woesearchaeota archaeon CG10_big_fil_rev_8_21_14_0_10_34_12]